MSEILEIVPGKSIGPYRLGMSRQEVWSQNRYPINCFYKSKKSIYRTDNIKLLGIYIFYDENERCNFIEASTRVQHNDPVLTIKDISLKKQNMADIQALCEMLSPTFTKNTYGFESKKIGLGFYCHNYENEESPLDGVSVMYPI